MTPGSSNERFYTYLQALRLLFIMYCGLLMIILFLPLENETSSINYYPFYTLYQLYFYPSSIFSLINIAGNIALFIPFGLQLPLISSFFNSFWRIIGLGVVITFITESLQYLLGGIRTADIDDIILNTIGIAIGYFIAYHLQKKSTKHE